MHASSRPARTLSWVTFAAVVVAAASVMLPFVLIHPFRAQTPHGLAAGALLRDVAPWIALAVAALAVSSLAWGWKRRGTPGRAASVAFVALAAIVAVLSRVDVYQRMFEPVREARFQPASEAAEFLGAGDMVLAVTEGGESVAYPVRILAYHHLVHDSVGGRFVVATY